MSMAHHRNSDKICDKRARIGILDWMDRKIMTELLFPIKDLTQDKNNDDVDSRRNNDWENG